MLKDLQLPSKRHVWILIDIKCLVIHGPEGKAEEGYFSGMQVMLGEP